MTSRSPRRPRRAADASPELVSRLWIWWLARLLAARFKFVDMIVWIGSKQSSSYLV